MPRLWRDGVLITAACAAAYLPGLTDHGLTNWQESIRLLAAQEMQARGDWITPTIHGEAYLAKPPLIYWCQLAIASVRDRAVGLFDLRLTVAIAGWLGALATWWAARLLLRDPDQTDAEAEGGGAWADRAAMWAGLFMATGVLTARSARIGELDILLVPATAIAVLGSVGAWTDGQGGRPARAWVWTGLATIGMAAAWLAKGPPGVLTAVLAVFGGAVIHAMRRGAEREPSGPGRVAIGLGAAVGGLSTAAFVLAERPIGGAVAALGAGFFVVLGAAIGGGLVKLARPRRLRVLAVDMWRTRLPLTPAIGLIPLWLWARAVASSDVPGSDPAAAARDQAAANINVMDLDAPARGLEVLGYGAGLGSAAAIACFVWLVKDRPKLPPQAAFAVAWVLFPLAAYSALGSGSHRYLLPMLGGASIVGGAWLASWQRDVGPRLGPIFAGAGVLGLTFFHGWWYGAGRDDLASHRSPRDFIAELLEAPGARPERLASVDLWTPALTVYAGAPVIPYRRAESIGYPLDAPTFDRLIERIEESGGAWTLVVRDPDALAGVFRDRGLEAREVRTESAFSYDAFETRLGALRVRSRRSAGPRW